jgi:hypothetical protein
MFSVGDIVISPFLNYSWTAGKYPVTCNVKPVDHGYVEKIIVIDSSDT